MTLLILTAVIAFSIGACAGVMMLAQVSINRGEQP
jgi:hypothetical protein